MKISYSLITRRTFLNTLFGGWLLAFCSGNMYALLKFAFPTLGKEPDFVILKGNDFLSIPPNSVKPFAWGGKVGLFLKKTNGDTVALKGVCTHMECNVTYKADEKRFEAHESRAKRSKQGAIIGLKRPISGLKWASKPGGPI